MTENSQTQKPQFQKPGLKKEVGLVRILSKDIDGDKNVYVGLTKIKGVSWSISNATCKILKISKVKKIGELSQEEIKKISDFLKNSHFPKYLLNRQYDPETGNSIHLIGNDLDMKKEFDIKNLKKIKSYRGIRHATGQPTRGQRTKSHFRSKNRKAVGVNKNPAAKKK